MKIKTMIKTLLLLIVFAQVNNIYAQDNFEPDFVGEALILKTDNSTLALEKAHVQTKSKANAGVFLVGIGSVKTRMTVSGCCSTCRVNSSDKFQLIIRAVDNNTDPLSIVKVFRFEKKKKERRAELSSASTFGGTSNNNFKLIPFTAKKYGKSSYIITLSETEPGEYGIVVANPNSLDEKSTIASCFGIDGESENEG